MELSIKPETKAVVSQLTQTKLAQYLKALDKIRDSGVMNMWGAGRSLAEMYGITHELSRAVHNVWMATAGDKTPQERAKQILTPETT